MPSKPIAKLTSKSVSKTRKDRKQSPEVTSVKFTVRYGDTSFLEKQLLPSKHKEPPPPYHKDVNFSDLVCPKQKEEEKVEAIPGFWMPVSLYKIWLKEEEEDYARKKERMTTQKEEEEVEVLFRPFDNRTKYIRTRDPIEGSPKVAFYDEYSTMWGIDLIWPPKTESKEEEKGNNITKFIIQNAINFSTR